MQKLKQLFFSYSNILFSQERSSFTDHSCFKYLSIDFITREEIFSYMINSTESEFFPNPQTIKLAWGKLP